MAYPTIESFMSRVSPPNERGCMEWLRSRNAGGYGIAPYWDNEQRKRRSMGAHRMSYLLHNPGVPLEGIVMHTCDNPACCNPDHLVQGTHKDNAQDMLAKSRHSRERKFGPRQRKLTDEQVRAIRFMAGAGHSDMHISLLFDVGSTHIRAIRLRDRKGHVSDDGPMAAIPEEYARGSSSAA
jgi:hypothetical protein